MFWSCLASNRLCYFTFFSQNSQPGWAMKMRKYQYLNICTMRSHSVNSSPSYHLLAFLVHYYGALNRSRLHWYKCYQKLMELRMFVSVNAIISVQLLATRNCDLEVCTCLSVYMQVMVILKDESICSLYWLINDVVCVFCNYVRCHN